MCVGVCPGAMTAMRIDVPRILRQPKPRRGNLVGEKKKKSDCHDNRYMDGSDGGQDGVVEE